MADFVFSGRDYFDKPVIHINASAQKRHTALTLLDITTTAGNTTFHQCIYTHANILDSHLFAYRTDCVWIMIFIAYDPIVIRLLCDRISLVMVNLYIASCVGVDIPAFLATAWTRKTVPCTKCSLTCV